MNTNSVNNNNKSTLRQGQAPQKSTPIVSKHAHGTVTIPRSVILNRNVPIIDLTKPNLDDYVTQRTNAMLSTIAANHPGETILFGAQARSSLLDKKQSQQQVEPMIKPEIQPMTKPEIQPKTASDKKVTKTPIILIPVDRSRNPVANRLPTVSYLLIANVCTHDETHIYVNHTIDDLREKAIKFITEADYGEDFPIVPTSNLIHCVKCIKPEHPLLEKSRERGSLNFVTNPDQRTSYGHITVPEHIPMDRDIFIDKDDVWVNLSLCEQIDIMDLKDKIIRETGRRNFANVISLPSPYSDMSFDFHDFGRVSEILNLQSYNDADISLNSDHESEDESINNDDFEDEQPKTQRVINKVREDALPKSEESSQRSVPKCTPTALSTIDTEFNDAVAQYIQTLETQAVYIPKDNELSNSVEPVRMLQVNVPEVNELPDQSEEVQGNELRPDQSKEVQSNGLRSLYANALKHQLNQLTPPITESESDVSEDQNVQELNLRIPMASPNDHKFNELLLSKYDSGIQFFNNGVGLYFIVEHSTVQQLNNLIDDITTANFIVGDLKEMSTFKGNLAVNVTSFTVLKRSPTDSEITPEPCAHPSSSSLEPSNLDMMIAKVVDISPDSQVTALINVLEKSFLQRTISKETFDIVFNFHNYNACSGISKRDYSALSNNYLLDCLRASYAHSKDYSLVLISLRYASIIPHALIKATDHEIRVSMC